MQLARSIQHPVLKEEFSSNLYVESHSNHLRKPLATLIGHQKTFGGEL